MFGVDVELMLNTSQQDIQIYGVKFSNRQHPSISLSEFKDILNSPGQYCTRGFDLAEYLLNTRRAVCSLPRPRSQNP
ncbi:unnamed protein product [Schistocephalus solidus]|uniref:Uncharacterized protein n=1 Tax=Schistocephalus solidus TaxID=70667 RepID=A0A183SCA3_SCHSO|nr:unnamed protein product [Schistocephalus solidus]